MKQKLGVAFQFCKFLASTEPTAPNNINVETQAVDAVSHAGQSLYLFIHDKQYFEMYSDKLGTGNNGIKYFC